MQYDSNVFQLNLSTNWKNEVKDALCIATLAFPDKFLHIIRILRLPPKEIASDPDL